MLNKRELNNNYDLDKLVLTPPPYLTSDKEFKTELVNDLNQYFECLDSKELYLGPEKFEDAKKKKKKWDLLDKGHLGHRCIDIDVDLTFNNAPKNCLWYKLDKLHRSVDFMGLWRSHHDRTNSIYYILYVPDK